ncbi:hypothetical protein [Embleya sp. AB8]|uniref:hypothetical protein n=1 Tax=Embleya sp. AB8 TaxID=3156304 RepID=UPI003C72094C
MGTFPYLASGTRFALPQSGETPDFGGTRPANAAARSDGWPQVLALLAGLTR